MKAFSMALQPDSLAVRFVANMSNISSLCQKENCPYISNKNSQESYSISGYDGIYVFDTFGLIEGWGRTIAENDSNETDIATKVYVDGEYQELNTNALELFGGTGMAADWRKSFVKPKSGNQKVKFSDKKHCNDTKIYQQNFGVDSDDGVKTKTMKKRLGTIWDKVNGPLEAAIKKAHGVDVRSWLEGTLRRIPTEKSIDQLLPCNWQVLPANSR